jgi:hypothetical protein
MLGETFEDVRMSFVAEKVQHQPLIMAFHAQGEGWELWGTSSGKTKFWGMSPTERLEVFVVLTLVGKSLEVIPLGTTHLRIGDDQFEWCRLSFSLCFTIAQSQHSGRNPPLS